MEQDYAKVIFARLLAVVHDIEEAKVDVSSFQDYLSHAEDAGVYAVWPIRGSNVSASNTITAMHYLPDLIHQASRLQQFDKVFPYLEGLLSAFSARILQPTLSPCLLEALTLLAEVWGLPDTADSTKGRISRLISQWGIMRIPIINEVGVWSSEPQPGRLCSDKMETVLWVAGALQADRPSTCNCAASAAMQLLSQALPNPALTADTVKVSGICV